MRSSGALAKDARPVLDHGFVRVVDTMGDDAAVVSAARVSYGKSTKTPEQDEKLIGYLLRNGHTSPFEMCEIKLHVKLPIFVARQWVRHRTANVNEISARYTVLPNEYYVPSIDAITKQHETNRQGRNEEILDDAATVQEIIRKASIDAYMEYTRLRQVYHVPKELARIVLPLNFYTEWYWKIDANNLMRFLTQRLDAHAQYEIREYAKAILEIFMWWMPVTAEAFERRNEV